jgi:division protein 1
MQSKFLNRPQASRPLDRPQGAGGRPRPPHSLLRLPTVLPGGLSQLTLPQTSQSLAILESVPRLESLSLDPSPGQTPHEPSPSLIRGFKATIPSSELAKQRRRLIRGGLVDEDMGFEKIGLKKLGDRARGLLTEGGEGAGASDLGVGSRGKKRRKGRHSKVGSGGFGGKLHLEDLVQQADEIAQDKENLHVRTVCLLLIPFVHSDAD